MPIKVKVLFLHKAGELVGEEHRIIVLELSDNAIFKDLVLSIRDRIREELKWAFFLGGYGLI